MNFRVFLLEDDRNVSESLIAAFEMRGIDVVHAATLAEARGLYDPGLFDVLVIDYQVPDGTGIDFLKEIDRDGKVAILFSGLDRHRELAAAGLDDVEAVNKAQLPELIDRINGLAWDEGTTAPSSRPSWSLRVDERNGRHTHVSVFVGPDADHRANAGRLVLDHDQFDDLVRLVSGDEAVEVYERVQR